MIELLLPCGFDTPEYSWVKATIGICIHVDYCVAKKCQRGASTPPFIYNGGKVIRKVTESVTT
jgi:hypothetical protein